MNSVSFRAFETTGSVGKAEPVTVTAKNESTGGVGYRANAVPVQGGNTLSKDTVNFKGVEKEDKGISPLGIALITLGATAAIIGGLGLANKYGTNIIKKCGLKQDGKIAEFLTKNVGEGVTGTCRSWCFKAKQFCLNLVSKFKPSKS